MEEVRQIFRYGPVTALFSCVGLVFVSGVVQAVTLGAPFSDGAVLQRDKPVSIWGKAWAGAEITVSFFGQEVSATADTNGVWRPARVLNVHTGVGEWAKYGNIYSNTVIVASREVPEPVVVRYAWTKPWRSWLYNQVDLPLGTFSATAVKKD